MDYQTVFLVGSSRSGTTWLQHMLGAHPNIATAQETDLFSAYVDRWRRTWAFHTRDSEEEWRQIRFKGLPAVLTEAEFDEMISDAVRKVHSKILSLKPSATTLLDKDPPYSLHVDLICRYVPDARFIHMVRDGRDVADSVRAAAKGWGRIWAPSRIEQAAAMWKEHVLASRRAAGLGRPYREVRYEELLSQRGPDVLRRLFDFCLVDADGGDCKEIYDRFTFDNMRAGPAPPSSILWSGEVARRFGTHLPEPEGFFREGKQGSWRQTWGRYDRWAFNRLAGDLLAELGYAGEGWPGTGLLAAGTFSFAKTLRAWPRQVLRLAGTLAGLSR